MIGGIVGLVLIGVLGWWLHKKRQDQKAAAYAQAPVELHAGPFGEKPVRYAQNGVAAPVGNTAGNTAELDGRTPYELDGSTVPVEADGRPIKQ